MCAVNYLDVPSIEKKCSYRLGDHAKACDMRASDSERENIIRASLLKKGDGAFVLRSDNTWRFAIVTQKVLGETPHIDFILNGKGSTKCVSLKRWTSNIRSFQSSSSSKIDQFINSLSSYLEIAEKAMDETSTSHYLKELVLLLPAKVQSFQEDALDDSRRESDPSSSWNQPPLPEITVKRRVQNKNKKPRSDFSSSSTTTKSMNDSSAVTKEDTDQEIEQERRNKSSDTQPIVQNEPQASKASRKDETRNRDRREYSDYSLYQQLKCEKTRIGRARRKTATPMGKTNDEECKMKSLRASVKCTSVTKFQSLFEECMHA
mmetsp:Transcript_32735/g.60478  ORF Transcript_32735/g.60478 Transcript_32735/m.60478 type:complete len:319 (+) Transcript_32735:585-1541(+)